MSKKLKLNKMTISNLSRIDLSGIKVGIQRGCWENLFTIYECEVVYTGDPQPGKDQTQGYTCMPMSGCTGCQDTFGCD